MADIENVPIQPGGTPGKKKELSMEMRLLLAFLLMGLVLFLTPYIYKAPPPPKKPVTPPAAAQVAPDQKHPQPSAAASASDCPAAPVPGQIQCHRGAGIHRRHRVLPHPLLNHGAVVTSWVLKKYLDHRASRWNGESGRLRKSSPSVLALLKDQQAAAALNSGLYSAAKPTADGLGIDYEFSDGKNYAKKSFRFAKNSYLSQITTEVKQNGVRHAAPPSNGAVDSAMPLF